MIMFTRAALAVLGLCALTPLARADYVSQSFAMDQSSVLPAGTTYGSVQIEAYDGNGSAGGGLSAGQVRLTIQANPLPVYDSIGCHFGVYGAGFNTDLALDPSQIGLPDHWRLRNGRFMGGFGQFGWEATGHVRDSQSPLVITISGLGTDATVNHFLIPSTDSMGGTPMNGSAYFAARVGGFDINNDWVDARTHVIANLAPITDPPPPPPDSGGPGPVVTPVLQGSAPPPTASSPEPSTLLLCVLGVGGLGVSRCFGRRGRSGRTAA
jgi:hypothetical protein